MRKHREYVAAWLEELSREALLQAAQTLRIADAKWLTRGQLVKAIENLDPILVRRRLGLSWWDRHGTGVFISAGLVPLIALCSLWFRPDPPIDSNQVAIASLLKTELNIECWSVSFIEERYAGLESLRPTKRARILARHTNPDNPEFVLAMRAMGEERYGDARSILDAIEASQDPIRLQTYRARAELEMYDVHYEIASRYYEKALQLKPDNGVLLDRAGFALYRAGRFEDALTLYQRANIRFKEKPVRLPNYIKSLSNLARVQQELGNYGPARAYYREALRSVADTQWATTSLNSILLNHLAGMYTATGAYRRAGRIYKRAMDLNKWIPRNGQPGYGLPLANLYRIQGRYDEAERIYRDSLQNLLDKFGEEHPMYVSHLAALANIAETAGRFTEAESLYKEATETLRISLGEGHPLYAAQLGSLGVLYRSMGDLDKAKRLLEKSVLASGLSLGERHPDYALQIANLADLAREQGDFSKAAALSSKALQIVQDVYGENHVNTHSYILRRGSVHHRAGEYAKAARAYEEAGDILRASLGESHPAYGWIVSTRADVWNRLGYYAKAAPLYEQALSIAERSMGAGHLLSVWRLANLARFYQAIGRTSEADAAVARATDAANALRNGAHPNLANIYFMLGSVHAQREDFGGAAELFQQALEITEGALGVDHPNYAAYLNSLAIVTQEDGRHAEAVAMYTRTRELTESVYGTRHARYAAALNNLAVAHRELGDYQEAARLIELVLRIDAEGSGIREEDRGFHLANAAATFALMGDAERAGEAFAEALRILEAALGAGHDDLSVILQWYADFHERMDHQPEAQALRKRAETIRALSPRTRVVVRFDVIYPTLMNM